MTTKQPDGGPAFPNGIGIHETGMTLRDWFAGQALSGWLASFTPDDGEPVKNLLATHMYAIADAMLEAREAKL